MFQKLLTHADIFLTCLCIWYFWKDAHETGTTGWVEEKREGAESGESTEPWGEKGGRDAQFHH